MANLTCFSIPGIKLWFYSNDHEPPHFHAKRKGEWEVKVNFLQDPAEIFELVWATKKVGMSKADQELLQEKAKQHRFEILREWEKKVQSS